MAAVSVLALGALVIWISHVLLDDSNDWEDHQ